jgi:tetratricopeptide (TPR) repeat protein
MRWPSHLNDRIVRLQGAERETIATIVTTLAPIVEIERGCAMQPPLLNTTLDKHLNAAKRFEIIGEFARARVELEHAITYATEHGRPCDTHSSFSSAMAVVRYREGHLYGAQGNAKRAVDTLRAADAHAFACQLDTVSVEAQLHIAKILALDLEDARAARVVLNKVRAGLARVGDMEPSPRFFDYHEATGLLARLEGNYDRARDAHERALAQLTPGHESPLREAEALINLGATTFDAGDYTRAREAYLRADKVLVTSLGAEYPETAPKRERIALNLGLIAMTEDDLPRALSYFEALLQSNALEIRFKSATSAIQPANELHKRSLLRRLVKQIERDLARADELPWRDVAEAHSLVGGVALDAKKLKRAIEHLEAAYAIWQEHAPSEENTVTCELMLARTTIDAGQRDKAKRYLEVLERRRRAEEIPEERHDYYDELRLDYEKLLRVTDRFAPSRD